MQTPVLSLQNVTVRKLGQTLFNDLNFTIGKGENWALVGESGAGKSALLQTIAGKFNVTGGSIVHHYFDEFIKVHPVNDPHFTWHKLLAIVSSDYGFRNLSNTTDLYYQQRFNSSDSEDSLTVAEYLSAVKPAVHTIQFWNLNRTISKLDLTGLLDKRLIKLSNGETKRLLIAAALLKNPALLLLDNPLTGLDVQTRAAFNDLLNEITLSGITVVLATSPNEIPHAITHVAILHRGKITAVMPVWKFKPQMVKIGGDQVIDHDELLALLSLTPKALFKDVVKMRNVTVKYGEKTILNNVNWHITQGNRWALSGPNGSGKSTLISLINGDNPQAYANDIVLFDRRRGTGESIWDIKSKAGFVSPELHQYFPTDNNCLQVVESGFYDTPGLFRQSDPQKSAIALRWMALFELGPYARKPLKSISASAQRLVLLARALVKNPSLLIFDEPCQGLDAHQQRHFKQLIDSICRLSNTTLIYVTHYPHEIPDSVNNILMLDKGTVAS